MPHFKPNPAMEKKYLDFIDFVLETSDYNYEINLWNCAKNYNRRHNNIHLTREDCNYLVDTFEYKIFERIPNSYYPYTILLTSFAKIIRHNYGSFTEYYNSELNNTKESDTTSNTLINTGNIIFGNNNENIDQSQSSSANHDNIINRLAKNPIIQIISMLVLIYTFLKIIESIFDIDIPII